MQTDTEPQKKVQTKAVFVQTDKVSKIEPKEEPLPKILPGKYKPLPAIRKTHTGGVIPLKYISVHDESDEESEKPSEKVEDRETTEPVSEEQDKKSVDQKTPDDPDVQKETEEETKEAPEEVPHSTKEKEEPAATEEQTAPQPVEPEVKTEQKNGSGVFIEEEDIARLAPVGSHTDAEDAKDSPESDADVLAPASIHSVDDVKDNPEPDAAKEETDAAEANTGDTTDTARTEGNDSGFGETNGELQKIGGDDEPKLDEDQVEKEEPLEDKNEPVEANEKSVAELTDEVKVNENEDEGFAADDVRDALEKVAETEKEEPAAVAQNALDAGAEQAVGAAEEKLEEQATAHVVPPLPAGFADP